MPPLAPEEAMQSRALTTARKSVVRGWPKWQGIDKKAQPAVFPIRHVNEGAGD